MINEAPSLAVRHRETWEQHFEAQLIWRVYFKQGMRSATLCLSLRSSWPHYMRHLSSIYEAQKSLQEAVYHTLRREALETFEVVPVPTFYSNMASQYEALINMCASSSHYECKTYVQYYTIFDMEISFFSISLQTNIIFFVDYRFFSQKYKFMHL